MIVSEDTTVFVALIWHRKINIDERVPELESQPRSQPRNYELTRKKMLMVGSKIFLSSHCVVIGSSVKVCVTLI